MLNRISILMIVLIGCIAFATTAKAQEVLPQNTTVNYNSGTLYAWPAYVSMTSLAGPILIGEVITNRPFAAVQNGTMNSGSFGSSATTTNYAPQPNSGWSGSINLPISPAPGGC